MEAEVKKIIVETAIGDVLTIEQKQDTIDIYLDQALCPVMTLRIEELLEIIKQLHPESLAVELLQETVQKLP